MRGPPSARAVPPVLLPSLATSRPERGVLMSGHSYSLSAHFLGRTPLSPPGGLRVFLSISCTRSAGGGQELPQKDLAEFDPPASTRTLPSSLPFADLQQQVSLHAQHGAALSQRTCGPGPAPGLATSGRAGASLDRHPDDSHLGLCDHRQARSAQSQPSRITHGQCWWEHSRIGLAIHGEKGTQSLKLGTEDCSVFLNSGHMVQHLSFQHWRRRPMPREEAGSPGLQLCPDPSGHRSG